jgi:amidase
MHNLGTCLRLIGENIRIIIFRANWSRNGREYRIVGTGTDCQAAKSTTVGDGREVGWCCKMETGRKPNFYEEVPPMAEMTIRDLQEQLALGALTARALTELYLERIDAIDRSGPGLRSVVEVNPDALEIAEMLDVERSTQGPRSALHGIPVLIKDNIDTGDRMLSTAGSLALADRPAAEDATVAARLRAAGAVILGKTNLSEWANFRSSHSVSGWSSRGGQTRNPYALDRNPCGSSSGTGVAVAADLCAAAVGTETNGSIICPAHANGIVGLKPTVGLISRTGIAPIAHSQDTAGPMARTVADAAALLGVLAGPDPRDPATESCREHARGDYTQFLDPNGLRGARIGVARNFFGFNPRVDDIMESCITALRDAGAQIVDPADCAMAGELEVSELEVLLYEFKADLNAYLAGRSLECPVRSLAELIDFNEQHRAGVMPYFGQDLLIKAEAKGPLTDEAYRRALADCHRIARAAGIDATLAQHRLDAIAAPSGPPAWLTDYVNGDQSAGSSSTPAAVAGYPSITVPAGHVWGLPVGISFFAGAYCEPVLIRIAYAFEQATRVRRAPTFLPTLDMTGGDPEQAA